MTLDPLPRYQEGDYGAMAQRVAIAKRTPPDTRGWGLPCRPGILESVALAPRPRDGHVFRRNFRVELIPLVKVVLDLAQDIGALPGAPPFEVRKQDEPSGGGFSTYNCRDIRGDTKAQSWHSWPVAFDLNPAGNPITRDGRFISRQPPWLVELLERSGWFWGGRWRKDGNGKPYTDAMHFEYLFRPEAVETDVANALAAAAEIRARFAPTDPHNPDDPDVPDDPELPEDPAVTPEQVRKLQTELNAMGTSPPLVVDGVYGPKTEAALTAARARYESAVDLATRRRTALDRIKAAEEDAP